MEDTPSRQHPEAGPSAAPARRWRLDIRAATWALAVFALELSQYLARLWRLRIGDPVLRVLLGSTPDWMDVLAYGIGGAAVLAFEAVAATRWRRQVRAVRPTACARRWWRHGR